MNNEEEKTFEINVSRFLFVVMNLLFPLVIGRFFGVIAERCAYGLIILLLALRYTEMCEILDDIKTAVEIASEEMGKKIAKKEIEKKKKEQE